MAGSKGGKPADYIVESSAPESVPGGLSCPDDAGCGPLAFTVPGGAAGERLDKALARLMPEVSRARVQDWIGAGSVTVNGQPAAGVRQKVSGGDVLGVTVLPSAEELAFEAEEGIEFDVVHEDSQLIVISKPAGLVVHPAAGHWGGTLLNGLLCRYPELKFVPRAGIVHRLDRDTTGLMVVARTLEAQTSLVRQLQERTVGREYWAVVIGSAPPSGLIDRSIGRDPASPVKFACRTGSGIKTAVTRFRLVASAVAAGRPLSWIACRLETGRTHQIRVHMTSAGLPLLGDRVYRTPASRLPPEAGLAASFPRQALHASRLRILHPGSGEPAEWFVPPPADMAALMDELGFGPLDRPVRVFEAD